MLSLAQGWCFALLAVAVLQAGDSQLWNLSCREGHSLSFWSQHVPCAVLITRPVFLKVGAAAALLKITRLHHTHRHPVVLLFVCICGWAAVLDVIYKVGWMCSHVMAPILFCIAHHCTVGLLVRGRPIPSTLPQEQQGLAWG